MIDESNKVYRIDIYLEWSDIALDMLMVFWWLHFLYYSRCYHCANELNEGGSFLFCKHNLLLIISSINNHHHWFLCDALFSSTSPCHNFNATWIFFRDYPISKYGLYMKILKLKMVNACVSTFLTGLDFLYQTGQQNVRKRAYYVQMTTKQRPSKPRV